MIGIIVAGGRTHVVIRANKYIKRMTAYVRRMRFSRYYGIPVDQRFFTFRTFHITTFKNGGPAGS